MRRTARRRGLSAGWLALLAGVSLPGAAHAGRIVAIEDGSGFAGPQVRALSSDGSVAGGSDLFAAGFQWNEGFVPVPALPGGSASFVSDLSQDGSVAVGSASDGTLQHPVRWTEAGGTVALGTLAPGQPGAARAVSADGSVVVGDSGGIPFRWTAGGGMLSLGVASGSAWGVSADGVVVAGTAQGSVVEAFRWTQAGGAVGLGTLPGHESSSGRALSADGSTIVGAAVDEDTGIEQAMRWTQSEGMVGLGGLPGCPNQVTATAVSGDGGLVAGECWLDDGITRRPFVWTDQTGILSLAEFLALRGVVLAEPLVDPEIAAVSDDGRVLAVVDADPALTRSFLIDVTPPVPALPPEGEWALALVLLALGIAGLRVARGRS